MCAIRVLIADDHRLFRQGLCQICTVKGGFEVVGDAENGREAIELARRLHPDVILMDIRMPVLDGVHATSQITAELENVRVIVLTMQRDERHIFEAIRAGAQGYLLKDVDSQVLLDAIEAVYR